jgi:hypothetical protein
MPREGMGTSELQMGRIGIVHCTTGSVSTVMLDLRTGAKKLAVENSRGNALPTMRSAEASASVDAVYTTHRRWAWGGFSQ